MQARANPANVAGMARYGIRSKNMLGVSMPAMRQLARRIGRDHDLAQELWASGILEARILAGLMDQPARVTAGQMERWARAFDSWAVCDQVCSNLFDKTPLAWIKAVAWAGRRAEFVKRAGFVLMAALAVHDKQAADAAFRPFFRLMVREATDERNFVKKAVNWALRQVGKRNPALRRTAMQTARRIRQLDSRAARWIAADALRELSRRGGSGKKHAGGSS
ncbi:MAG: DNA alkylation repair protein [Kiritimatiellaeota bacterium]|nr:DNA alkylation repair protein [Kiritimatiellota bacterium]